MHLKHLQMGFTVCWANLDEMRDVIRAVVNLRAIYPTGRTALANDDELTQEEASHRLEQLSETAARIDLEKGKILDATRPESLL